MTVYYNEYDPEAASWLREIIKKGLIADGEVDDRSILDVSFDDLCGFTQCHFFAGIGGWSYALRLAGIPDDMKVWTGSPPCQPFSTAGQQKGKDDERHLAPHFTNLIAAGRPPILFGEQVASAAVFGKVARKSGSQSDGSPEWAWIDDLQDRLEAAHYAVGLSDIPAASVGAPHIRQRTFFGAIRLADTISSGLSGQGGESRAQEQRTSQCGVSYGFTERSRSYHDFWRDADWIFCRDGKWRPVEPSTFPLAHGLSARVGRLRGYGNAIVPQVAATFVEAFIDAAS